MKKNLMILKMIALSLFLVAVSCQKDIPEQTGNTEQTEKEVTKKPFESGVELSYLVKETSYSDDAGKNEPKIMAGKSINHEEKEVNIYFDSKRENYQITTRRLNKYKEKDQDFIEPAWREKVETNYTTTRYGKGGEILSSLSSMQKDTEDLSYIVTPYPERSEKMKEMLETIHNGSKSVNIDIEVQNDTNVVKVSKYFQNDEEFGKEMDGYTAVSYINVKYGVPVVSELYDPAGNLTSKVSLLYKMIDKIPVVAYEEAKSFTINSDGEIVEHTTITNYENIHITNF
ncbi:MAG: hypothetical protein R6V23_05150 [Bacteroidales bacterium]